MKALVLNTDGADPSLEERDIPTPRLRDSDVLVQVAACGVCHHDLAVLDGKLRRGVKPDLVLGHEISGVVAEVGDAVSAVRPGDRIVAALTAFCGECGRCMRGQEYRCIRGRGFGHALDGGFAQFVRLPERSAIAIPNSLDIVTACALACPVGVALNAAQDAARLQAGETAVVVGAGGGLGVHLAQAAATLGARVIAVTGSESKVERLEALGGVEVILADSELDFSEIVLALTEDDGADVVLNPVGSALFGSCLASAAQFGRIVALGEISGKPVRFNIAELLFRDASVIGATGASVRHIRRAIDMAASGGIRPIVSRQYAFADAADAFDAMRSASAFGRITLIPPPL